MTDILNRSSRRPLPWASLGLSLLTACSGGGPTGNTSGGGGGDPGRGGDPGSGGGAGGAGGAGNPLDIVLDFTVRNGSASSRTTSSPGRAYKWGRRRGQMGPSRAERAPPVGPWARGPVESP